MCCLLNYTTLRDASTLQSVNRTPDIGWVSWFNWKNAISVDGAMERFFTFLTRGMSLNPSLEGEFFGGIYTRRDCNSACIWDPVNVRWLLQPLHFSLVGPTSYSYYLELCNYCILKTVQRMSKNDIHSSLQPVVNKRSTHAMGMEMALPKTEDRLRNPNHYAC